MQKETDTLKATNADLQTQIKTLNNKVSSLQKQDKAINTSLNNSNTLITNNTNRINKIEARETKLYDTFRSGYTNVGIYVTMTRFKNGQ